MLMKNYTDEVSTVKMQLVSVLGAGTCSVQYIKPHRKLIKVNLDKMKQPASCQMSHSFHFWGKGRDTLKERLKKRIKVVDMI